MDSYRGEIMCLSTNMLAATLAVNEVAQAASRVTSIAESAVEIY